MIKKQYVLFTMGEETYGADINTVREIIMPVGITKVPSNPPFIEGVINLRGQLIPVLDLKKRFKLGTVQDISTARFVIANVNSILTGFTVDEVTEVLRLDEEQIEPAPEVTKIGKEYVQGIAKIDGKLLVLLDLSKVLTVKEKEILEETLEETQKEVEKKESKAKSKEKQKETSKETKKETGKNPKK